MMVLLKNLRPRGSVNLLNHNGGITMTARRRVGKKPVSSRDVKPVTKKEKPFSPERKISVTVSRTVQMKNESFFKVGFMHTESIKDDVDMDEAYDAMYDTLLEKVEDKIASYDSTEPVGDEPEEPEYEEQDEPEEAEPEPDEITEEEIDEMTKKELVQFIRDEELEVPTNQKIKDLREAIKDEIFIEEPEGGEGEEWEDENWGDE